MKDVEFEFQYASMHLEPYAANKGATSERLLKDIFEQMGSGNFPSEYRVIDKHENRTNTSPRKLVHISSPLSRGGLRCFGKIALIKNKDPMMWGGKDIVEEIQKDENSEFIEMTNYVINFNTDSDPIIMIEFNSAGPRLSDVEYFIRQVSKRYRIAKAINVIYHLELEYSDLNDKLTNIFDVKVKVDSIKHLKTKAAPWYRPFIKMREETGYKDVKMEFFYGRSKEKNGTFIKNIRGLSYARSIIEWLKQDDKNIENLDDLKMTYEIENSMNVKELDFLKNKTTSFVYITRVNNIKKYTRKDFITAVGQEFNYYLSTGKTNKQK